MPRSINLRPLVPALLLAAILAVGVAPAGAAGKARVKACPNANAAPGATTPAELGLAAQCLLNNERSRRHMVRLRGNKRLAAAAAQHNQDMVDNHYFRHESPRGKNVIDRLLGTGYIKRTLDWLVGENLAWGTEKLATPRRIVNAWMRSPGHRRNILNRRFREIGVAVVFAAPDGGGKVAATYTTVFGYRK